VTNDTVWQFLYKCLMADDGNYLTAFALDGNLHIRMSHYNPAYDESQRVERIFNPEQQRDPELMLRTVQEGAMQLNRMVRAFQASQS